MEVSGLSLPLVFAAGVVSFISPCVLPLVPGYLATVTGAGLEPVDDRRSTTRQVASGSALFLRLLPRRLRRPGCERVTDRRLPRRQPRLAKPRRRRSDHRVRPRDARARLVGRARRALDANGSAGAFAFCWTPCVGPILASILVLAGATASLASGVLLLLVYGIGLAMPFVAVGFGLTRVLGSFRRVHRYYRAIEAVAGVLLVAMGALLLSGYLYLFNVYAQHALRALGLDWWTSL